MHVALDAVDATKREPVDIADEYRTPAEIRRRHHEACTILVAHGAIGSDHDGSRGIAGGKLEMNAISCIVPSDDGFLEKRATSCSTS